MREYRRFLVLLATASLLAGCASKPSRQPRILSSYTPPGAGQAAPLNSRQAIQVPSASMGTRPLLPAAGPPISVQAVPVQQVPVQQVPVQQVPAQQVLPAQQVAPQGQLVPAYPGQPNTQAPANSNQNQFNGQQNQQQQNGSQEQPRQLIAPSPGDLDY